MEVERENRRLNTVPRDPLQRIRKAYQSALEAREPSDRDSCPDPATLLELAEGMGPEACRLEALDHAMSCPICRRELDLLRALAEARPRTSTWLRPWMAAAASVVLLVGAGSLVWWQWGQRGTVYRGAPEGVALVSPEPGGTSSGVVQFVWSGEPDAFQYVLEILDAEGVGLLRDSTADTSLVVDLRDHPAVVGRVRWWVIARLEDGTEMSSETRNLELPGG